jgi:hypothetical protein
VTRGPAKTRTRATTAGKGKKAGKSAEDDAPATLEGFNMGTNKRRRKMRQLLEKVSPLAHARVVCVVCDASVF